jgi:histidinol-phosphate aminotransferase
VINPSSVSSVSQAAACAAMEDQASADFARQYIAEQRHFLSTAIGKLGLKVVPSQTSFILIDFETTEQADSAFQFLRQHRLVVRPMGGYGLPACLRITIGTPGQMRLMANTLAEWREGNIG